MRRDMRTTRRRSRGQALVEFALVFPIALIVLFGVFDVGRAVFIYNGLTNAAREGARLAIVNQDVAMVEKRVQDAAFGSAISNIGDPADPVVAFYREEPDLDDPTQNDLCEPAIVTGCVAVVTARADWSAITPIISAIIGPIPLTARSELPVEFVCPNIKYPSYATSDLCPNQKGSTP
jgi:Flp pilus assembly protein TadG